MRSESITPRGERIANWLADHFTLPESAIGYALRLGHLAESVISAKGVTSIIQGVEKIIGTPLPKWNRHIPYSASNVFATLAPGASAGEHPRGARLLKHQRLESLDSTSSEKQFIYFPSCISRQLGQPKSDNHHSLTETLIHIAQRASINLQVPENTSGTCCGMPFHSKGYAKAYQLSLHKIISKFWDWSEEGKHPIVIDTTSCAQTLRTCGDDLGSEDKERWLKLTLLDSIEFLHDYVLSKLEIQIIDENVILHPNCSARKLGLEEKMLAIAKQCAKSATVPLNLGCCGFAGDRGLLFPELTASATQKESAEVNEREYGGYYSSNIPCEIGMSEASGRDYTSIVYLVERASRR